MRRTAVLAAVAAAMCGAGVVGAVPAVAAPAASAASVCSADGGDPDPFTGKATRRSYLFTVDGRSLQVDIRSGNNAAGQQFAWAKLSTSGAALLRATDQVWLEISTDSGATWARCGVTSAVAGSTQVWTHGFATSTAASVRMVGAGKVVSTPVDVVGRTPTW